jgi:hypothetical protein
MESPTKRFVRIERGIRSKSTSKFIGDLEIMNSSQIGTNFIREAKSFNLKLNFMPGFHLGLKECESEVNKQLISKRGSKSYKRDKSGFISEVSSIFGLVPDDGLN